MIWLIRNLLHFILINNESQLKIFSFITYQCLYSAILICRKLKEITDNILLFILFIQN